MTSRERVARTLKRQATDRAPLDLWGSACRIHTEQYKKIADHLGYTEYGELVRPGTTTEYVDYRISDAVGCDFRHTNIGRPDGFKKYTDDNGNTIDEWGIGRRLISGYNAISHNPLQNADIDDLKKHTWPVARDEGRIRGLREQARQLYESTDYAITATSAVSGTLFEMAQYLRGTEDFFADLYENPDFVRRMIDKLTEIVLEINLYYLEAVGDYVEWIEFTEDVAMQRDLFISRKLFHDYFDEPHKLLFSEIKRHHPNIKIFYHSCGAMYKMIPDILSWGVDILNPLQPTADGMDIAKIKKEFGRDVIFHGGIDIQRAMIGSTEDVQREVRERIDVLGDGGGYILAPTNHILSDVPVENFFTLYQYANMYSLNKNSKKTGLS
jgi:uroporphyrinogen decarboxylase